jgi:hypothetical protein
MLPRRVPSRPDLESPDTPPAAPGDPNAETVAVTTEPALLRASAGPETPGGLPRRVKQASLAPGLRTDPEQAGAALDSDADLAQRTPEQARATMAAYQQGWSRGRSGTGSGTAAPPAED